MQLHSQRKETQAADHWHSNAFSTDAASSRRLALPHLRTNNVLDSQITISVYIYWPHLQHMDVPGPAIKSTPQQRPQRQLWQCQILNPLCHQGTPSYHHLEMLHFLYEKNTQRFNSGHRPKPHMCLGEWENTFRIPQCKTRATSYASCLYCRHFLISNSPPVENSFVGMLWLGLHGKRNRARQEVWDLKDRGWEVPCLETPAKVLMTMGKVGPIWRQVLIGFLQLYHSGCWLCPLNLGHPNFNS